MNRVAKPVKVMPIGGAYTALWFVLLGICAFTSGQGQCPASQNTSDPTTTAWSGKLLGALSQEDGCAAANTDASFVSTSACNIFVGRVLKTVYGVDDFIVQPPTPDKVFYTANEVGTLLQAGVWPNWTEIGTADSQANLESAESQAGAGNLVIAVWVNPVAAAHGHIALIGPGPMTASSNWGLNVPPAAAFRMNSPASAFIGQPLSCAFGPDKRSAVHIWVKTP
jgi:hypothetical protein